MNRGHAAWFKERLKFLSHQLCKRGVRFAPTSCGKFRFKIKLKKSVRRLNKRGYGINHNLMTSLEAATRFELVNSGFADRCLTTWLCRPKKMERETGFEPATSTLARSHSTTELFPLNSLISIKTFGSFVNRKVYTRRRLLNLIK
jgi:hypothetical protein